MWTGNDGLCDRVQGVGSKIMAKMGYVVGQGLGKHSEGRAEPVPIQLLPQGWNSSSSLRIEFMLLKSGQCVLGGRKRTAEFVLTELSSFFYISCLL